MPLSHDPCWRSELLSRADLRRRIVRREQNVLGNSSISQGTAGALTSLTMASKRGARSSARVSGEPPAMPFTPLAYTTGKSHCSSVAHSSQKRSKVESMTKSGLQAQASHYHPVRAQCMYSLFRQEYPENMGEHALARDAAIASRSMIVTLEILQEKHSLSRLGSRIRGPKMEATAPHLAAGLSILLTTTMTFFSMSSALRSTKRVCGIGPSTESTRSSTPARHPLLSEHAFCMTLSVAEASSRAYRLHKVRKVI